LGTTTANPLDWRVSITVNFSVEVEKKVVCKGSVIYAGFFDVSETVTVESRQKFVAAPRRFGPLRRDTRVNR
jgi:preprotein translocase subunit SecB